MMDNRASFWIVVMEGAKITWADFDGYYWPQFFWSAQLRGRREVECTFHPQLCLPNLTN